MKLKKKTLVAEVVIRKYRKDGKPLPDYGLGEGVLMRQEIGFTDKRGRGFNSPLFAVALMEHEDRLMKETVGVRWTEKKPGRKNKK